MAKNYTTFDVEKNGCHGNQLKQNHDQKNRHGRFSMSGH